MSLVINQFCRKAWHGIFRRARHLDALCGKLRNVKMGAVVEAAHDHPVLGQHDPADRAIGGPVKGKRLRATGQRQSGTNHPAMHKGSDALIRMGRRNPRQRRRHPVAQLRGGFSAGNFAPFLIGNRALKLGAPSAALIR